MLVIPDPLPDIDLAVGEGACAGSQQQKKTPEQRKLIMATILVAE
ncbi:hypothetical protein AB6U14_27080 [Klebsiella pneumoniae]